MTAGDQTTRVGALEVVSGLSAYRAAEEAMRRRTRESMKMGENDLSALRFLLKAQQDGRVVTPGMLAEHLRMKSASVTVMLDRLTRSGHLTRSPHPTDRRSLAVVATPGSDDEVRHTLGEMHRRMMAVASSLGPHEAEVVRSFFVRLSEVANREAPRRD
ncbi:MarR family transcriptional regulator [Herbiconiux moechotypicola]|uniref:HTH marR-type domain-containing protein n=1 Tax=Herbiconiux moechotypicola TaxID=637393 RepID=A0ABP5QM22_9MICO|nr:MarR family transcriptional regulator [Herbiconiux moechotypicola]MCS5731475.1 MarR family transcriptional regulator [Herbiconiux moechotypicola]